MQIKKEQLQRQQKIMAHLGFYRHKCDGIWGPESISAKKRWEADPSFIPALPNNGLPFGDRDPLPKGMTHSRTERMFSFAGMDLNAETPEPEKKEEQPAEKKEEQPSINTEGSHNAFVEPESEEAQTPEEGTEEQKTDSHNQQPQSMPNFKKKKKHQHR